MLKTSILFLFVSLVTSGQKLVKVPTHTLLPPIHLLANGPPIFGSANNRLRARVVGGFALTGRSQYNKMCIRECRYSTNSTRGDYNAIITPNGSGKLDTIYIRSIHAAVNLV